MKLFKKSKGQRMRSSLLAVIERVNTSRRSEGLTLNLATAFDKDHDFKVELTVEEAKQIVD